MRVRFRLQRRPPMPCQPIKKPVKIKARPDVVVRVGVGVGDGVGVGRLPPSAVGQLGSWPRRLCLCLAMSVCHLQHSTTTTRSSNFYYVFAVIFLGKELTVKFGSCATHARTVGTTTQLSLPRKVAQVQCVSLARPGTDWYRFLPLPFPRAACVASLAL